MKNRRIDLVHWVKKVQHSQLSISSVQFCSSSGYRLRSIIQAAVVVILNAEQRQGTVGITDASQGQQRQGRARATLHLYNQTSLASKAQCDVEKTAGPQPTNGLQICLEADGVEKNCCAVLLFYQIKGFMRKYGRDFDVH